MDFAAKSGVKIITKKEEELKAQGVPNWELINAAVKIAFKKATEAMEEMGAAFKSWLNSEDGHAFLSIVSHINQEEQKPKISNYESAIEQAWSLIIAELWTSEKRFAGWPYDPLHGAASLAKEAGDAIQAARDYYTGAEKTSDKIIKEAAQAGAMALRLIVGVMNNEKLDLKRC